MQLEVSDLPFPSLDNSILDTWLGNRLRCCVLSNFLSASYKVYETYLIGASRREKIRNMEVSLRKTESLYPSGSKRGVGLGMGVSPGHQEILRY